MIASDKLPGKRFILFKSRTRNNNSSKQSNALGSPHHVNPYCSGYIRCCSANPEDKNLRTLKLLLEYDNGTKTEEVKFNTIKYTFFIEYLVVEIIHQSTRRIPALVFTPLYEKNEVSDTAYVQLFGTKKLERISKKCIYPFKFKDHQGRRCEDILDIQGMEDFGSWLRIQKTQLLFLKGPYTISPCELQYYSFKNVNNIAVMLLENDTFDRTIKAHDGKCDTIIIDPNLSQVCLTCSDEDLDQMMSGIASKKYMSRNHRREGTVDNKNPLVWKLPSWVESQSNYMELLEALLEKTKPVLSRLSSRSSRSRTSSTSSRQSSLSSPCYTPEPLLSPSAATPNYNSFEHRQRLIEFIELTDYNRFTNHEWETQDENVFTFDKTIVMLKNPKNDNDATLENDNDATLENDNDATLEIDKDMFQSPLKVVTNLNQDTEKLLELDIEQSNMNKLIAVNPKLESPMKIIVEKNVTSEGGSKQLVRFLITTENENNLNNTSASFQPVYELPSIPISISNSINITSAAPTPAMADKSFVDECKRTSSQNNSSSEGEESSQDIGTLLCTSSSTVEPFYVTKQIDIIKTLEIVPPVSTQAAYDTHEQSFVEEVSQDSNNSCSNVSCLSTEKIFTDDITSSTKSITLANLEKSVIDSHSICKPLADMAAVTNTIARNSSDLLSSSSNVSTLCNTSESKSSNVSEACNITQDNTSESKSSNVSEACNITQDNTSDSKSSNVSEACNITQDNTSESKSSNVSEACIITQDNTSESKSSDVSEACNITQDNTSGSKSSNVSEACIITQDNTSESKSTNLSEACNITQDNTSESKTSNVSEACIITQDNTSESKSSNVSEACIITQDTSTVFVSDDSIPTHNISNKETVVDIVTSSSSKMYIQEDSSEFQSSQSCSLLSKTTSPSNVSSIMTSNSQSNCCTLSQLEVSNLDTPFIGSQKLKDSKLLNKSENSVTPNVVAVNKILCENATTSTAIIGKELPISDITCDISIPLVSYNADDNKVGPEDIDFQILPTKNENQGCSKSDEQTSSNLSGAVNSDARLPAAVDNKSKDFPSSIIISKSTNHLQLVSELYSSGMSSPEYSPSPRKQDSITDETNSSSIELKGCRQEQLSTGKKIIEESENPIPPVNTASADITTAKCFVFDDVVKNHAPSMTADNVSSGSGISEREIISTSHTSNELSQFTSCETDIRELESTSSSKSSIIELPVKATRKKQQYKTMLPSVECISPEKISSTHILSTTLPDSPNINPTLYPCATRKPKQSNDFCAQRILSSCSQVNNPSIVSVFKELPMQAQSESSRSSSLSEDFPYIELTTESSSKDLLDFNNSDITDPLKPAEFPTSTKSNKATKNVVDLIFEKNENMSTKFITNDKVLIEIKTPVSKDIETPITEVNTTLCAEDTKSSIDPSTSSIQMYKTLCEISDFSKHQVLVVPKEKKINSSNPNDDGSPAAKVDSVTSNDSNIDSIGISKDLNINSVSSKEASKESVVNSNKEYSVALDLHEAGESSHYSADSSYLTASNKESTVNLVYNVEPTVSLSHTYGKTNFTFDNTILSKPFESANGANTPSLVKNSVTAPYPIVVQETTVKPTKSEIDIASISKLTVTNSDKQHSIALIADNVDTSNDTIATFAKQPETLFSNSNSKDDTACKVNKEASLPCSNSTQGDGDSIETVDTILPTMHLVDTIIEFSSLAVSNTPIIKKSASVEMTNSNEILRSFSDNEAIPHQNSKPRPTTDDDLVSTNEILSCRGEKSGKVEFPSEQAEQKSDGKSNHPARKHKEDIGKHSNSGTNKVVNTMDTTGKKSGRPKKRMSSFQKKKREELLKLKKLNVDELLSLPTFQEAQQIQHIISSIVPVSSINVSALSSSVSTVPSFSMSASNSTIPSLSTSASNSTTNSVMLVTSAPIATSISSAAIVSISAASYTTSIIKSQNEIISSVSSSNSIVSTTQSCLVTVRPEIVSTLNSTCATNVSTISCFSSKNTYNTVTHRTKVANDLPNQKINSGLVNSFDEIPSSKALSPHKTQYPAYDYSNSGNMEVSQTSYHQETAVMDQDVSEENYHLFRIMNQKKDTIEYKAIAYLQIYTYKNMGEYYPTMERYINKTVEFHNDNDKAFFLSQKLVLNIPPLIHNESTADFNILDSDINWVFIHNRIKKFITLCYEEYYYKDTQYRQPSSADYQPNLLGQMNNIDNKQPVLQNTTERDRVPSYSTTQLDKQDEMGHQNTQAQLLIHNSADKQNEHSQKHVEALSNQEHLNRQSTSDQINVQSNNFLQNSVDHQNAPTHQYIQPTFINEKKQSFLKIQNIQYIQDATGQQNMQGLTGYQITQAKQFTQQPINQQSKHELLNTQDKTSQQNIQGLTVPHITQVQKCINQSISKYTKGQQNTQGLTEQHSTQGLTVQQNTQDLTVHKNTQDLTVQQNTKKNAHEQQHIQSQQKTKGQEDSKNHENLLIGVIKSSPLRESSYTEKVNLIESHIKKQLHNKTSIQKASEITRQIYTPMQGLSSVKIHPTINQSLPFSNPLDSTSMTISNHDVIDGNQPKADQSKSDQSKVNQSKADQSKADQSKVNRSKADQSKADQSKADQSKADQSKADQKKKIKAKTSRSRNSTTKQNKTTTKKEVSKVTPEVATNLETKTNVRQYTKNSNINLDTITYMKGIQQSQSTIPLSKSQFTTNEQKISIDRIPQVSTRPIDNHTKTIFTSPPKTSIVPLPPLKTSSFKEAPKENKISSHYYGMGNSPSIIDSRRKTDSILNKPQIHEAMHRSISLSGFEYGNNTQISDYAFQQKLLNDYSQHLEKKNSKSQSYPLLPQESLMYNANSPHTNWSAQSLVASSTDMSNQSALSFNQTWQQSHKSSNLMHKSGDWVGSNSFTSTTNPMLVEPVGSYDSLHYPDDNLIASQHLAEMLSHQHPNVGQFPSSIPSSTYQYPSMSVAQTKPEVSKKKTPKRKRAGEGVSKSKARKPAITSKTLSPPSVPDVNALNMHATVDLSSVDQRSFFDYYLGPDVDTRDAFDNILQDCKSESKKEVNSNSTNNKNSKTSVKPMIKVEGNSTGFNNYNNSCRYSSTPPIVPMNPRQNVAPTYTHTPNTPTHPSKRFYKELRENQLSLSDKQSFSKRGTNDPNLMKKFVTDYKASKESNKNGTDNKIKFVGIDNVDSSRNNEILSLPFDKATKQNPSIDIAKTDNTHPKQNILNWQKSSKGFKVEKPTESSNVNQRSFPVSQNRNVSGYETNMAVSQAVTFNDKSTPKNTMISSSEQHTLVNQYEMLSTDKAKYSTTEKNTPNDDSSILEVLLARYGRIPKPSTYPDSKPQIENQEVVRNHYDSMSMAPFEHTNIENIALHQDSSLNQPRKPTRKSSSSKTTQKRSKKDKLKKEDIQSTFEKKNDKIDSNIEANNQILKNALLEENIFANQSVGSSMDTPISVPQIAVLATQILATQMTNVSSVSLESLSSASKLATLTPSANDNISHQASTLLSLSNSTTNNYKDKSDQLAISAFSTGRKIERRPQKTTDPIMINAPRDGNRNDSDDVDIQNKTIRSKKKQSKAKVSSKELFSQKNSFKKRLRNFIELSGEIFRKPRLYRIIEMTDFTKPLPVQIQIKAPPKVTRTFQGPIVQSSQITADSQKSKFQAKVLKNSFDDIQLNKVKEIVIAEKKQVKNPDKVITKTQNTTAQRNITDPKLNKASFGSFSNVTNPTGTTLGQVLESSKDPNRISQSIPFNEDQNFIRNKSNKIVVVKPILSDISSKYSQASSFVIQPNVQNNKGNLNEDVIKNIPNVDTIFYSNQRNFSQKFDDSIRSSAYSSLAIHENDSNYSPSTHSNNSPSTHSKQHVSVVKTSPQKFQGWSIVSGKTQNKNVSTTSVSQSLLPDNNFRSKTMINVTRCNSAKVPNNYIDLTTDVCGKSSMPFELATLSRSNIACLTNTNIDNVNVYNPTSVLENIKNYLPPITPNLVTNNKSMQNFSNFKHQISPPSASMTSSIENTDLLSTGYNSLTGASKIDVSHHQSTTTTVNSSYTKCSTVVTNNDDLAGNQHNKSKRKSSFGTISDLLDAANKGTTTSVSKVTNYNTIHSPRSVKDLTIESSKPVMSFNVSAFQRTTDNNPKVIKTTLHQQPNIKLYNIVTKKLPMSSTEIQISPLNTPISTSSYRAMSDMMSSNSTPLTSSTYHPKSRSLSSSHSTINNMNKSTTISTRSHLNSSFAVSPTMKNISIPPQVGANVVISPLGMQSTTSSIHSYGSATSLKSTNLHNSHSITFMLPKTTSNNPNRPSVITSLQPITVHTQNLHNVGFIQQSKETGLSPKLKQQSSRSKSSNNRKRRKSYEGKSSDDDDDDVFIETESSKVPSTHSRRRSNRKVTSESQMKIRHCQEQEDVYDIKGEENKSGDESEIPKSKIIETKNSCISEKLICTEPSVSSRYTPQIHQKVKSEISDKIFNSSVILNSNLKINTQPMVNLGMKVIIKPPSTNEISTISASMITPSFTNSNHGIKKNVNVFKNENVLQQTVTPLRQTSSGVITLRQSNNIPPPLTSTITSSKMIYIAKELNRIMPNSTITFNPNNPNNLILCNRNSVPLSSTNPFAPNPSATKQPNESSLSFVKVQPTKLLATPKVAFKPNVTKSEIKSPERKQKVKQEKQISPFKVLVSDIYKAGVPSTKANISESLDKRKVGEEEDKKDVKKEKKSKKKKYWYPVDEDATDLPSIFGMFDNYDRKAKNTKRQFYGQQNDSEQAQSKKRKVRSTNGKYSLQTSSCDVLPHLPKCIDCQDGDDDSAYCRFTMFRRLFTSENGKVKAAGVCAADAAEAEDLVHWVFQNNVQLDVELSKFILQDIGMQFHQLVEQEMEALTWGGKEGIVAWKRAVLQVREMCDICATTMFNIHWTCDKCGFGVCLDCFRYATEYDKGLKSKPYSWPECEEDIPHETSQLIITQTVPKSVLFDLLNDMLDVCRKIGLKFKKLDLLEFSHHKEDDATQLKNVDKLRGMMLTNTTNKMENDMSNENMEVDRNIFVELELPTLPTECIWFCGNTMLHITKSRFSEDAMKWFQSEWSKGKPVIVANVHKNLQRELWNPDAFREDFGQEKNDIVNCYDGSTIEKFSVWQFWKGFESVEDRPILNNEPVSLLKLKDWPPGDDFKDKMPNRFADIMQALPAHKYTQRTGELNLASRLPAFFAIPDLGPKMYNAYGSASYPKAGTTNLHLDISDATNVIAYVGIPHDDVVGPKEIDDTYETVDRACCEATKKRIRQPGVLPGALWHIFPAHSAEKIRRFLRRIAHERAIVLNEHSDPIHDQAFYLDQDLLDRLYREEKVKGYAICQCLGDAVFIPAGAPHQVLNLHSCIKVAEDFVAPEHITHCFQLTQEFRHLSDFHTNHEDKLQIKNIIYHSVKDALGVVKKHYRL